MAPSPHPSAADDAPDGTAAGGAGDRTTDAPGTRGSMPSSPATVAGPSPTCWPGWTPRRPGSSSTSAAGLAS